MTSSTAVLHHNAERVDWLPPMTQNRLKLNSELRSKINFVAILTVCMKPDNAMLMKKAKANKRADIIQFYIVILTSN